MLDIMSLIIGWLLGVVSLLGGLMLGKRKETPVPKVESKEAIDRQWNSLMAYTGDDQTLEVRDDEGEN